MQYTLTVHCGEKTCATVDAETGSKELCKFVRTSHYGTRFYCALFVPEKELPERDGWLIRSKKCLEELKKVAA